MFKEKVYEIVKRIPKGKVMSYGQVAKLAGRPKAARAVGMIMKNNKNAPAIPCHRVVASDGSLRGYAFGGIEAKKKILREEGVEVVGEKVSIPKYLLHRLPDSD